MILLVIRITLLYGISDIMRVKQTMAKHIYKKWCIPRPNDDILNRYGILINNINMMKRKCCCMKFTIPFHIFLLLLVSCGCMNWFAACMMRIWCIYLQRYVFFWVISYKTIICITIAAIISYVCCAYADKQCLLKLNNINPMLLLVCCGKSTKIFRQNRHLNCISRSVCELWLICWYELPILSRSKLHGV